MRAQCEGLGNHPNGKTAVSAWALARYRVLRTHTHTGLGPSQGRTDASRPSPGQLQAGSVKSADGVRGANQPSRMTTNARIAARRN